MAAAGQRLREGGLVAFPTETVYGLGASAYDEAAVRRIFEVGVLGVLCVFGAWGIICTCVCVHVPHTGVLKKKTPRSLPSKIDPLFINTAGEGPAADGPLDRARGGAGAGLGGLSVRRRCVNCLGWFNKRDLYIVNGLTS